MAKARSTVAEKSHQLSEAELDQIAERAGIGAVKYADLSTSRTKDYSFDVERMVSFSGNTGVYLQYAHTRICSILRKAGDGPITVDPTRPLHPAERALALALALTLDGFGDVVAEVGRLLEPHASAYIFTTWPKRSPTSMKPAPCSPRKSPPGPTGSRCAGSDLRKLSSGKPLTSYIAHAELCKSRLNSASYLLTGQFNM